MSSATLPHSPQHLFSLNSTVCFSHTEISTLVCMRQSLRGLTPYLRERMIDTLTKKVNPSLLITVSKNVTFLKAYIFLNYKRKDISNLLQEVLIHG
jgi:hypothetical protein